MSFMNPNYLKSYNLYKKMPAFLTIAVAILSFVWSIINVTLLKVEVDYYYDRWEEVGVYTYEYGILGLESAFPTLLIWWAIGAVLCAATWFFACLSVSPVIARTDAVISLNRKVQ